MPWQMLSVEVMRLKFKKMVKIGMVFATFLKEEESNDKTICTTAEGKRQW